MCRALTLLLAFFVATASAQRSSSAIDNVSEENENSVEENPRYAYAYEVADDEEQVYQARSEEMHDNVVSGEYSWVDPVGTRHVVNYRADASGFHIVNMREEVGAVQIREKQEKEVKPEVAKNARKLLRVVKRPRVQAQQQERVPPPQQVDAPVQQDHDEDVSAVRQSTKTIPATPSKPALPSQQVFQLVPIPLAHENPFLLSSGRAEQPSRRVVALVPAHFNGNAANAFQPGITRVTFRAPGVAYDF